MSCDEIRLLLSEMIDGELKKKMLKNVESHLKECVECKIWFEQLQFANNLYQKIEAPSSIRNRVMSKIKKEDKVSLVSKVKNYFEVKRIASITTWGILSIALALGVWSLMDIYRVNILGSGLSLLTIDKQESLVTSPKIEKSIKGTNDLFSGTDIARKKSSKSTAKLGRKIIKTASIKIEIKSGTAKEKLNTIYKITEQFDGYIVDSNLLKEKRSTTANAIVRVPESRLKKAIDKLSILGSLKKFTQTGEDITDEYVDLVARIKQLKAAETAYRKLFSRAAKVPDLLEIQEKLSDVQTEIEQLQAQLDRLDEQVDFATINISLYERKKVSSFYEIWEKNKVIEKGLAGLIGLVSIIVIGSMTIFPLVVVFIIIGVFWHFLKRWQSDKYV